MIDLETLDTVATSKVLSIGLCFFNKKIEASYCFYPTLVDQLNRTMSEDTLLWWLSQNEEARFNITNGAHQPLKEVMQQIRDLVISNRPINMVWGNGSDFDNAIIQSLFRDAAIEVPWQFWYNRCFRTIKDIAKSFKIEVTVERTGAHSAMQDAIYQAKVVMELQQRLARIAGL